VNRQQAKWKSKIKMRMKRLSDIGLLWSIALVFYFFLNDQLNVICKLSQNLSLSEKEYPVGWQIS